MQETGERVVFTEKWRSLEHQLMFLREVFAYNFVATKILPKSIVLEIGFGEGFGTKILEKKAKKLIALDVDEKTFIHANKKYASSKISFQLYDGLKIPFKDNYFDAVVSLQVIEHIKDDITFVNEIWRVAKKNALIILTTPNAETRSLKNGEPWNEFHFREYSLIALENLLNKKFSFVKIYGISAKKSILLVERNRIKKAALMASLDPFKFRKHLPSSIKSWGKRLIKKLFGYEQQSFDKKEYDFNDFFISEKDLQNSLDLVAICKK